VREEEDLFDKRKEKNTDCLRRSYSNDGLNRKI